VPPPLGQDAGSVHCRLDELLTERGMTLTRLSELVGISFVNLSVLKNDRARAVRFSTLAAICSALKCEVGDLFEVRSAHPHEIDIGIPAPGTSRR
jgi:putative transcriptional regulator